MRRASFILAALLTAAPASALPMTSGTWIPAPAASNSGDAPWNHQSADCVACNAGFVMGIGPGWEYLDAPWSFGGVVWTEVFSLTAFSNRAISQLPGGAFDYRNLDTGDHYTSDGTGWTQWVLARHQIDALTTEYLGLLEDMGLARVYPGMGPSDRDYQDSIWRAVVVTVPGEPDTRDVPEPASLALIGVGSLAMARRLRRRG